MQQQTAQCCGSAFRAAKHATKSSLKLSKADKGKKISCRVTAQLAGFANGVATTSSVKVS